MNVAYPVAIKRLSGQGIVKAAAKHNLREIAAEIGVDGHIDPHRIKDNLILRGPSCAEDVAKNARLLMTEAGIKKLRVDAVMGLELLFTLPSKSKVDVRQYFEDATCWAETYYGVPVLSSIVHLDENCPHCHVMLLPLVKGRMVGSDMHGHASKLNAMQTNFHEKVSSKYGFIRQTPTKRHAPALREAAIQLARHKLQADSAFADVVFDALLEPHRKNPEPLLLALGLAMPAAKPKTKTKKSFVAIMTQPMKKETKTPIDNPQQNPIGLSKWTSAAKSKPYPCVGFGFPIGLQDIEQRFSSQNSRRSSTSSYALIAWPQIVVGRQGRDPSQANSGRC